MTTRPINGFFPALIQSRFGKQGNFELATTYSGPDQIYHFGARFRSHLYLERRLPAGFDDLIAQ